MENTVQSPIPQSTPAQPPATTKSRQWSWLQLRWPKLKQSQPATPAQPSDVSIQVFDSVGRIDRGLLWIFEIVSSLAVVLLAAGLVTSQTNVQTHGAILTDNQWMQDAWAWTQNVAIDMSLLGAIIRAAVYWLEKEYRKAVLYGLLAILLLFTAFIVSDVEAMYQSLQGVTIDAAWSKLPLVSIEMLKSIRSLAIVLLLVAHATQYINWYQVRYRERRQAATPKQPTQAVATTAQPALSSEDLAEQIRKVLRSELAAIAQSRQSADVQNFVQNGTEVEEITQPTQQAAIAQHSSAHDEHRDDEDATHITQQATQPALHIVRSAQSSVFEAASPAQAVQDNARGKVFAHLDAHPEDLENNQAVMDGAGVNIYAARRYRGEYKKMRGAQ